jgi:5'-AMP-activated protein kinase catalytic alpha subunit
MHQIINGVDYIHKLGVAHRDLKPENLLLQLPQKDILIVDFGLSNSFKDAGLLKTACGSPCYAAPEMIAGRFYDGEKTDIWSCGVIMYALLCGYLPFEDDNTQLLYKKILTADFHIPRFVSSDGKDLIRNILTVDPQKRFTIEQIRSHSWWKLYQQEEPAVPAQPPNVKVSMLPNSIYVAPQPQYPSIEIEHEEPTQLH